MRMPTCTSGVQVGQAGRRCMAAIDEIGDRLSEFKSSGLIADYELLVVDDSIRVRVVAPRDQDAASVKSFIVESLAGLLSESQVNVEEQQ